ncbi:MAG: hypothetical protein ABEH89_00615 [bacterium]
MRQVMFDFVFRIALLALIIAGFYSLFMSVNVPLMAEKSKSFSGNVHFATYPEVIFLVSAFLGFVLLVTLRQILLLGFVFSQVGLYYVSPHYVVFAYKIPYYVLIAVNGMYCLILYFMFNSEKWAPGSLEGETKEYERID